jgi:hypothetical protein
MSSGGTQRKDGKDRTEWKHLMHFLFDFLGNHQFRIVGNDFRDMIINQMNVIPKLLMITSLLYSKIKSH